jgi:hypothetical protein
MQFGGYAGTLLLGGSLSLLRQQAHAPLRAPSLRHAGLRVIFEGDELHTLAMLSDNGHCMLSDVSASFFLTACTIMHSVSFLTLMSPLNAGGFQSYTENCDSFLWRIEFFPFDL